MAQVKPQVGLIVTQLWGTKFPSRAGCMHMICFLPMLNITIYVSC